MAWGGGVGVGVGERGRGRLKREAIDTVLVTGSGCCMAETNTTSLSNYSPIKNKNKKEKTTKICKK